MESPTALNLLRTNRDHSNSGENPVRSAQSDPSVHREITGIGITRTNFFFKWWIDPGVEVRPDTAATVLQEFAERTVPVLLGSDRVVDGVGRNDAVSIKDLIFEPKCISTPGDAPAPHRTPDGTEIAPGP